MHKLITLSLLLLTSYAIHANRPYYTLSSNFSSNVRSGALISINVEIPTTDSTPAPKVGFLKKLLRALQFTKNARAREQVRVLNIISRSGLRDSLQASVRTMDSINTVHRTVDISLQQQYMMKVLGAIDSLRQRIDSLADEDDATGTDPADNQPASPSDVNVDGQDIQELVNQVVSPGDTQEQENLVWVRSLLFRSRPLTDTVKISDSISVSRRFGVRRTQAIIGYLSNGTVHSNLDTYFRLMTELSWYAVGFKGSAGKLTNLNGWDTSPLIDSARARGCRISLCILSRDKKNITDLLKDTAAQQTLATNIVAALRLRQANGVQIEFDSLPASFSTAFTYFIMRLASVLEMAKGPYSLGIRVPGYDPANIYELQTLKSYADHLLLDFTQHRGAYAGPLAPLASLRHDDVKTCVTRCLNMGIPSAQLIVCLPYYGVSWKMPDHRSYKGPPERVLYKTLCSNTIYQLPSVWDPKYATVRLDVKNKGGALVQRVWYDDERSLAAKYDLVIAEQLGGVAIQSLGDDEGYGELWDVLASKFARVDTSSTTIRTIHKKEKVLDDWQWSWAYIEAKLEQYRILFSYPCEAKFPKVLVRKWEEAGLRNNDRSMIRKEAATVLGRLSLTLMALFLGGVLLFITQLRRIGDGWKWTKPLAGLLIFLFIALTITGFMYLFLDSSIVYFGVSDSPADCFDFPLGILFIVIFTGIAIGVLITRFLVFPLIKRDDVP